MGFIISSSQDWEDYELLDSGNGLKLERYGLYRLVRPEAEAVWLPSLSHGEWKNADAEFKPAPEENGGHWDISRHLPDRWPVHYKNLACWVQTTASRHVGLFPEQAGQWDWIAEMIRSSSHPLQVLNLFGYTGLASLAAAAAGAKVTHLDASPKVVTWARQNQALSGLGTCPIRWIVDDAVKFVEREGRRENRYNGLILDPPKFGRGPKGEVWEFYKLIPHLLKVCRGVLSAQPKFIILTAYAVKASSLTLSNALAEMMKGFSGSIEFGEVVLQETSAKRNLSMAVFARWASSE